MLAELCAFIAAFVILAYFYWTKNYRYWENRSVPCLSAEFPWGSLKGIDPFKGNINHFLESLYKLHEYEPVIGFYGPTEPFLLIKDLNLVKSVLVSDFNSFQMKGFITYGSVDPVIRYNPLGTQDKNEWKNTRGIHSPLFTLAKVKASTPQMIQNSKSMVEFIRNHSHEDLNVKLICWNFAVDSILNVGFGVDNDSFKTDSNKFPLASPGVMFGSEWFSNAASYCSFFLPWLALILRCRTIETNAGIIVREWGDSLVEKRKKSINSRVDLIQRMMERMEKDKQKAIQKCPITHGRPSI